MTLDRQHRRGLKHKYPEKRRSIKLNSKTYHALNNSITAEFVKYAGQPNASRSKRTVVKQYNPLHFIFGERRPVWKTWESYAWNMGLLEDEDSQTV